MPTALQPTPRPPLPTTPAPSAPANLSRLRSSGIVLGLGIGGFIDGILFHMLLQWHHVICVNCLSPAQTPDDLRLETFSDGIFHVLTLCLVVTGVFMLWKAVRRAPALLPPRFLVGAITLGWGIFNVVEGIVDHHILGIHHVKPGPDQGAWDLAFLASGVVLGLLGAGLLRSAGAVRR